MKIPPKAAALLAGGVALCALSPILPTRVYGATPVPALVRLSGHVRPEFAKAPVVGPILETEKFHLTIGLLVRNPKRLAQLVAAVSDPKSPTYRHFLTPKQFTGQFGPTLSNYNKVLAFAKSANLTVTRTYANRLVVDVDASAAQVEKAFTLKLVRYHRVDGSEFYAPDREPSVPTGLRILHISGLDNYVVPVPNVQGTRIGTAAPAAPGKRVSIKRTGTKKAAPNAGSGVGGLFGGNDFRNAYAPGITLEGTNQSVGLLEFNTGFFPDDIAIYEQLFSLPNTPVQTVLLDGFNGAGTTSGNQALEIGLDIEMAVAMAPGLSDIVVYEGGNPDSIFAAMASPPAGFPLSSQLSASWTFGVDGTSQQLIDEMAVQGQSFFSSSGDNGAYGGDTNDNRDMSNMTVVGGTILSMNGNGASWSGELAWPSSGGGVENTLQPAYQAGVATQLNGGSSKKLNLPDVAMVAQSVIIVSSNGVVSNVVGTSIATPLWAAFTALVNQQGVEAGLGPIGFIDPVIYEIGGNPAVYESDFHDIVSGSNGKYQAMPGYDLVTGWGSPNAPLINTLSPLPPTPTTVPTTPVPPTVGPMTPPPTATVPPTPTNTPTPTYSQLQILIYTGSDDLRPDSDVQISFSGIGNMEPICLMRSNNGADTGVCTGGAYGDQHGTQGFPAWSTQSETYTNRFTNWTWAGSGSMTLTMTSHNNGLEGNDNWDIQAMSVVLSNPATGESVTLFNSGEFGAPHNSGHCYWRFKTTGSPPTISQTFNFLPATTATNNCPNDN